MDPCVSADRDRVRLALAVERRRALGNLHVSAELLRLRERATGERLAGDAGREAEIVLDLRARAGLATGRVLLDDEHIEAFRCRVDGGRKARRTRADDDEVVDMRCIQRLVEAEAFGDGLVARVAQHEFAPANEDGHVVWGNLEPVEQGLDVGVAIQVEVGIGMDVARQEFLHAQRAGAVYRADHDHVAEPVRHQLDATQDERADQDLADLRIGLHDREQVVAVDLDDLAGLGDQRANERAASGEQVHFARELPGPVARDEVLAGRRRPIHVDAPREHDEERRVRVARVEQHFALRRVPAAPVPGNARELGSGQRREHSPDRRGVVRRHGCGRGRRSHRGTGCRRFTLL